MPYGTIKVDNIVFTNSGIDQTIGVSGLVQSVSGNLTATGTISGNLIRGNTVSGATITGGALTVTSGIFAPGASGAPSISFTGDNNTGFWSPAGDTVAFSTGGSERMRLDALGDLGIGTTDPTSRLTVRADAASGPNTVIRVENRAASAGATTQNIKIEGIFDYNNGTSDASAGAIVFGKDGTYTTATTNNDSYLALETVLNNTSTERLRITSDGKVGIGTSSPAALLHVAGNIQSGVAGTDGSIILNRATDGLPINAISYDGATEEMRLNNGSGNAKIVFQTVSVERARIDSAGNVGIGTSSVEGTLHLAQNDAFLHLEDPRTTADGSHTVSIRAYKAFTGFNNLSFNSASHKFEINSIERARIDSSGRLLVGTSTATNNLRLDQKFAVVSTGSAPYGGASFTTYASTGGATGPRTVIDLQRSRGATDGSFTAVANNDELGSIIWRGADGSQFLDAANISALVDGTPGANDMPTRLVFSTTADGASSPTDRMQIDSAGNISIQNGQFQFTTTNFYISGGRMPYNAGNLTMQWNDTTGTVSVTTSTRLLKKDIEDSPYGIEAVKALQPRTYTISDKKGDLEKIEIGFIADEVANVVPEIVPWSRKSLVTGNEEDEELIPMSVQYDRISVVLVKALQEAIARIETLETKIAALEAV